MKAAEEKSLRGWQAEALPSVFELIDDHPIVRAVMGAGKSVLISEIVNAIPCGLRVVISTPSVSLVDDLAGTLDWWAGIKAGKWYTHEKSIQNVTICCNPSLASLADHLADEGESVELWIADEAHKTECSTVKDAIDVLNPYRRVGFTATPWRADGSERLSLFDSLAFNYTAAEAIADGVVVPPIPRHYRGDADTLNEACAEAIKSAIDEDLGPGLVNARNIEDAEEFVTFLYHYGITARSIHSELSPDENRSRKEDLKDGRIHCLVHVDMLAEGVDMPWLRWLVCRRPVGSSVRFAQEVGRVLRSDKGKEHAIVFDPHNLFSHFALDAEAMLSGGCDDDPIRLPALKLDFLCDEIRKSPEPPDTYHDVPIKILDPVTSYLVKIHLQMQFLGFIDPEIKSRHWRGERASGRQIDLVKSMSSVFVNISCIPPEQKRAMEIACASAPGLKKGAVSDLISVLMVFRDLSVWPYGLSSAGVGQ